MKKLLKTMGKMIVVLVLLVYSLWPGQSASERSAAELPEGASIAVHFIDVGQADAALIICDGETMLIDGGNAADSNLIYSYLDRLGVTHLDYIVCTHAHEDHVGGLSGALNYASVEAALAPVTDAEGKTFQNFKKMLSKQGVEITVPAVGDTYSLGSGEFTVLSCDSGNDDPNATSIMLRLVHGETSFLFTGDAEYETEQAVLETGLPVRSTVLKVGHHGSNSSSCYSFLRAVAPEYAVISVGKDNSYGHPHDNVVGRLEDADAVIYRTDTMGDVVCVGDGKTLTFTTERGTPAA